MAVYVDWMQPCVPNKNWRYKENCHLMADTLEELHEFAQNALKLKRNWFQSHARHPHYDLTRSKRTLAIKCGAFTVNLKWYKEKLRKGFQNVKQRTIQKISTKKIRSLGWASGSY